MSNQSFCGQCGVANSADASFCTDCGSSLHQETPIAAEVPRHAGTPTIIAPTPPTKTRSSESSSKAVVALSIAVVLLTGSLLWNQFGGQPAQDSTSADIATTDVAPTTTSSTTTTSTSTTSTTTTTTTLVPVSYGFSSSDLWIDDTPMAQPACDGSYIAIIASTDGFRAASGSRKYSDGNYLRTDITCNSLNPYFSSGSLQGQPIYLIFFGPYYNRYEAQQKCLDLGIRKKANCYVAPLTLDSGDRSVRYGPLDS